MAHTLTNEDWKTLRKMFKAGTRVKAMEPGAFHRIDAFLEAGDVRTAPQVPKVHFEHAGPRGTFPSCFKGNVIRDVPVELTTDRSKVTCGSCRRTTPFRRAT